MKNNIPTYLREYLTPLLGDTDKIELLLYLLINDDGVYQNMLPNVTFFETNFPQLWEDEMVQLLSKDIVSKIKRIKEQDDNLYNAIKSAWPNLSIHLPELTKDKFIRSLYNVKSRAAAIMTQNNHKTVCLLPVYDFMNHGKDRNTIFRTTLRVQTQSYHYEIAASRDIKQGEEVYNQYGQLSNIELFERYGFVFEISDIPLAREEHLMLHANEVMDGCKKYSDNCSSLIDDPNRTYLISVSSKKLILRKVDHMVILSFGARASI